MPAYDLAEQPVRALNQALHLLKPDTNERLWTIENPDGAHAIAVGLDAPISVEVEGNVGYYCGGMNKQASVTIRGTADPRRRGSPRRARPGRCGRPLSKPRLRSCLARHVG